MLLYNLFPAFYEENQLTDTNPFKPCKGHIDAERFMKFTGLATAINLLQCSWLLGLMVVGNGTCFTDLLVSTLFIHSLAMMPRVPCNLCTCIQATNANS